MNTTIYYFSATGNSLALSKKLANLLGETELISIPKIIDKNIETNSQKIGFVFPIYGWGLPRIVTDFIKNLKIKNSKYIFALASCGGTPSKTLLELNKILREKGLKLDAGFVIREENNLSMKDSPIIKFVRKLSGKKTPKLFNERIDEIIEIIKNNKKNKLEKNNFLTNFIGGKLHNFFIKASKTNDNIFCINENCTLCGTCKKLCPRNNIIINDNKIIWQHNCEFCLACINWCPNKAIKFKGEEAEMKRYHNDNVKLKEMILR